MNLKNSLYPYASGDLLENANTYFYTPFNGYDFLRAFSDKRSSVLAHLPEPEPAPLPKSDGYFNDDLIIETSILLEYVLAVILDGKIDVSRNRRWLEELIKKFEVTKRIHRQYGKGFRAIDRTQHKDYTLYIRLTEVFDAAYSATHDLRLISVMIKSLDTLCSIAERLDSDCQARLAALIVSEKGHVETLCRRKGLKAWS